MNSKKNISITPCCLDIICIASMIGMNPILYFISLSPGIFFPDLFAYATMAKDLFSNGLLYIPSWGHVDNALILPPLYPFLIAIGRCISSEAIIIAEYISSICMLFFAVPAYFFIRKMANRIVAVISIILIQINYYFFYIGIVPLTESLFLLTIALTLWILLFFFRSSYEKQKVLPFLLGLSCSFVFLSRQIGIVVYVFVGILFLIQWLLLSMQNRRILLNNFLLVVLGAMVILIPYSTALYLQTDQHPLKQNFRKNEYVVKVSDPEILNKIEQEKKLPDETMKFIEKQSNKAYGILYATRRSMRKLIPDASEMYCDVCINGEIKAGIIKRSLLNLKNPGAYLVRIYNNILHLKVSLGGFGVILFFIFCLTSFFIKVDSKRIEKYILPSFVITYLLLISLLTDKIDRYVYILFPFCIMHISIEAYRCFGYFKKNKNSKLTELLSFTVLFVLFLLTTPRFFTDLELNSKILYMEDRYGDDFNQIVKGEPVFSLSPYEAYIIGSPYRILPNDSLEKVVAYGKKTGVRWIILFYDRSLFSELLFNKNLDWYRSHSLERNYPGLVKFRLGRKDGSMMLYEIL